MTTTDEAIRAAVDALADAVIAAIRAEAAAAREPASDRLMSIDEAAAALGIGRSHLYAEIGAGRLRSLTSGRRRLVPSSAVTEYIERRS